MDGSDTLIFLMRVGMRKRTFCVIPKVKGLLPLDGLSWNCGFWACTKICRLSPIVVKTDKSNKNLTWRITHVYEASLWFVFRMKTICVGVRRWETRNSLLPVKYWDRVVHARGTIYCKPRVSVFIWYRLWISGVCVYLVSTVYIGCLLLPGIDCEFRVSVFIWYRL